MSTPTTPTSIPTFAQTQLDLLSRELQAELSETSLLASQHAPATLARAGLAILNLQLSTQRTGLGGKTVLELSLDPAVADTSTSSASAAGSRGGNEIPEHGIRVGDIVGVAEQPRGGERKKEKSEMGRKGVEGVVLKVTATAVQVALDKEEADVPGGSGKLWMCVYHNDSSAPVLSFVCGRVCVADIYRVCNRIKLANDVTYKRMNQVMSTMQKMSEQDYTPFMRVLFGQASITPVPADLTDPDSETGRIQWVDPSLNDSQKDAIRFAMASREVALIHGPPGTGKTHTLIELILQLLKLGQRLLVCGPSNISVDNIVERLSSHKVPMIRLGHPARLLPSVLNHSLDVLTKTSAAGEIVKDVRQEMDSKQGSIRKTRNGRERRAIYGELKDLRKEYRERERKCVDDLVRGSKVVLATLHGAGGFHLKNAPPFDVVIIDEASQALEAQCWVPLLAARKVVLAGDHLQLPPTIKSLNAKVKKEDRKKADSGEQEDVEHSSDMVKEITLETTLFDRLLVLHGPSIKRMLTTQYRMHEQIMAFPSQELYEGKLIAADSVKTRLLTDLPYKVQDTEDTREPLVFWDTQGGEFPEKAEDDQLDKKGSKGKGLGESKSNELEAALVKIHVQTLVDAGVLPEDIAVVTPYNAQVGSISISGAMVVFPRRLTINLSPCSLVFCLSCLRKPFQGLS